MSEEKKAEPSHYDDAVKVVDGDAPSAGDDLAYAQVKATLALADAINALATIAANKTS